MPWPRPSRSATPRRATGQTIGQQPRVAARAAVSRDDARFRFRLSVAAASAQASGPPGPVSAVVRWLCAQSGASSASSASSGAAGDNFITHRGANKPLVCPYRRRRLRTGLLFIEPTVHTWRHCRRQPRPVAVDITSSWPRPEQTDIYEASRESRDRIESRSRCRTEVANPTATRDASDFGGRVDEARSNQPALNFYGEGRGNAPRAPPRPPHLQSRITTLPGPALIIIRQRLGGVNNDALPLLLCF